MGVGYQKDYHIWQKVRKDLSGRDIIHVKEHLVASINLQRNLDVLKEEDHLDAIKYI